MSPRDEVLWTIGIPVLGMLFWAAVLGIALLVLGPR